MTKEHRSRVVLLLACIPNYDTGMQDGSERGRVWGSTWDYCCALCFTVSSFPCGSKNWGTRSAKKEFECQISGIVYICQWICVQLGLLPRCVSFLWLPGAVLAPNSSDYFDSWRLNRLNGNPEQWSFHSWNEYKPEPLAPWVPCTDNCGCALNGYNSCTHFNP